MSLVTPWGELGDLEFWLWFPVPIPRTQTLWGQHLFILFNAYVLSIDFWCQGQGCVKTGPLSSGFASAQTSPLHLNSFSFRHFFLPWKQVERTSFCFHKIGNRPMEGSESPRFKCGFSNWDGNGTPFSDSETTALSMAVTRFLKRKLLARAWRHGFCTWQVPLGLDSGTLCPQMKLLLKLLFWPSNMDFMVQPFKGTF